MKEICELGFCHCSFARKKGKLTNHTDQEMLKECKYFAARSKLFPFHRTLKHTKAESNEKMKKKYKHPGNVNKISNLMKNRHSRINIITHIHKYTDT